MAVYQDCVAICFDLNFASVLCVALAKEIDVVGFMRLNCIHSALFCCVESCFSWPIGVKITSIVFMVLPYEYFNHFFLFLLKFPVSL
jgi:hypothetical protein